MKKTGSDPAFFIRILFLRRDARVAEGGALLRRYTGLNPYRGFESLSLRHYFQRPKKLSAMYCIRCGEAS
jgi:hypothetical protein